MPPPPTSRPPTSRPTPLRTVVHLVADPTPPAPPPDPPNPNFPHPENDLPPHPPAADSRLSLAGINMSSVRAQVKRQSTLDVHTRWALGTEGRKGRGEVTLVATADWVRVQKECAELVHQISRDSRLRNKRFRDANFDIGGDDQTLCLQGLLGPTTEAYSPASVSRVPEIFPDPVLFKDGVNANDIRQGQIGDCWFVSALAVVSNIPHLIERLCVERDERIGVYGFMFFRDGEWTTTVIDDQLFEANVQFDQLQEWEKRSWHNDRRLYEDTKLRGSRALYFASASDPNETWVPLYEKAYAKAHGDYEAMCGGYVGEAIEDLTGGVSSLIHVKDILDTDQFWTEELMKANKDRLFACYIQLNQAGDLTGLVADHAYSILQAKEVNGKRFVFIRNPWGEDGEWKGAWSDGGPEWTPEWMKAVGHTFGNDGRFVMEYSDFLKVWQTVDRCRLFDDAWTLSTCHVEVKVRPWPAAPSFGDVSFTVTITKETPAIFVLSQHDTRYFLGLEGYLAWGLEFRVFKERGKEPIARSDRGDCGGRSVNTETVLEPGTYIVHIRLDRQAFRKKDYLDTADPSVAKLARVTEKLMQSKRKAPNYDWSDAKMEYLSPPSTFYDGRPLSKIPKPDLTGKAKVAEGKKAGEEGKEGKKWGESAKEEKKGEEKKKADEPAKEEKKVDEAVREEKKPDEAVKEDKKSDETPSKPETEEKKADEPAKDDKKVDDNTTKPDQSVQPQDDKKVEAADAKPVQDEKKPDESPSAVEGKTADASVQTQEEEKKADVPVVANGDDKKDVAVNGEVTKVGDKKEAVDEKKPAVNGVVKEESKEKADGDVKKADDKTDDATAKAATAEKKDDSGKDKDAKDDASKSDDKKVDGDDKPETPEEKEKAAKEEERKKADSVFIFLRVYSLDPDSKISAETRL